ncbi:MAG: FKBP-type peptidyl-prolyl cis-trans isomerase [Chloroflexi bacterium]|nr:FKBP-type peptidyl-prolyl cis-trans isomerase [Chloroflexota bacterium]
MRLARRRRRRNITVGIIIALLVITASGLGFWQYQKYTADQLAAANKIKDQHATATANVDATHTAAAITPTPSAGPTKPPQVTGTPVKLAGGLEYIDVQVGTGPAAKAGGTVSVEYTGWIQSSGKKFDSSYDHGGQPFSVTPLGQAQVIPGWNQGLIGIQAGGTRRLIIPPSLAYGAQGYPPVIPPNATLIFDVTAISVQ